MFSARSVFGTLIVFCNEVFSCYVIHVRVNCVSYIKLSRLSVSDLPLGLLTLRTTPLFLDMSDSEETRACPIQNIGVLDPSVGAAIQSAVSESIGSLSDNFSQVVESRLSNFAKRFSEENNSSVEQAVKKAWREQ